MRIMLAKAVLVIVVVSSVTIDAYPGAGKMGYSVAMTQPAIQSELFRAYGFVKGILEYLMGPEVDDERRRTQSDVCNRKRILTKEHGKKCGLS